MQILSRLLRGKRSDLLTCIVQRRDGVWQATWVAGGRTPGGLQDADLASLLDNAADDVGKLYAGQPEAERAELQFAIYPFRDGGPMILDLERTGDGFRAADIQGSGVAVTADSLDALIEQVARLPQNDQAMFRWVRPVRDLPPPRDPSIDSAETG